MLSTSFTAAASGKHTLYLADPSGRAWGYDIKLVVSTAPTSTDAADYDHHIKGSNDEDKLFGTLGNDLIEGGDDDDYLYGLAGDDHLIGGTGNDLLEGGPGADYLNGGDGADRFVLNRNGTGTTTVLDFDASEGDRVRVDTAAGNEGTLAALGLAVADDGADARITSTDGSDVYMILENIDHALITDASFGTYFDVM